MKLIPLKHGLERGLGHSQMGCGYETLHLVLMHPITDNGIAHSCSAYSSSFGLVCMAFLDMSKWPLKVET
eukprot:5258384-Amphidinium_carterae.1